ncbi:MAG: response regulator [Gammaproteobacteria bacterium]|nr:response regulator [Gammaproteobacteria bacterium]
MLHYKRPTIYHTRHSLGRSLLIWFLLLALLPLSINAWIAHRQAVHSLTIAATEKLKQGAELKAFFIQNWFNYRLMNLRSQAEDHHNIQFLSALKKSFRDSGKKLSDFIESDSWRLLANSQQNDIMTFFKRHNYIYDLFLIDEQGNILFTIEREFDLGTNIFTDDYAGTRFAIIAKETIAHQQALFSDFSGQASSNNLLSGFLTVPILDNKNKILGLFAIQLQLGQINEQILKLNPDSSLTHYLVGADGLLRSPVSAIKTDHVLQRINTEQFQRWKNEYRENGTHSNDEIEPAFSYMGPNDKPVIGMHQTIRLPGVNWLLISEIDEDEALASAHKLGEITLVIFILTGVLVIGLASYQTQRITRPIIKLVDASVAVAAGKLNQQVEIDANNEIGVLADAFNEMITTRKRHMDVLEESNQIAQMALSELAEQKAALDQHSIVAITDIQGNITFANEKFTEISGYSRQELLGQNHRMLKSDCHDTAFFREMYRTIASGKTWHGEICNTNKNGDLYWLDTTIAPFIGENGKPQSYITIRTDITEYKRVTKAMLEAKEVAEAATRQKSEFLANMSHEIRTPMNGVIGMTELLLDTSLTPKQLNYAEATRHSADALLTIINDILDFSKIEAGKMELEDVAFDLQSLTQGVTELMALKCHKKKLEMLLRYKPGTHRFVIGDPGRIRQILLNLLSNAIKFTEQGNILLTVESAKSDNNEILFHLTVQDTGIGIAEDKLEKIFNKFDQEDGSTTRKYGGTGLGLSICKQLSKMMQGDIQVSSKKGQGSSFTFSMKLQVNNQASTITHSISNYQLLKGLKTLIIDDVSINRTILVEQLSPLGMQILNARSGQEAIDILQQAMDENAPFDIIITDYQISKIDSEVLVTEILNKQLLAANPVILFIASSPRRGDSSHLKALGFDGYLSKPIHPAEVPQILAIIREAKQQGRTIPMVTHHTLRETRAQAHKETSFSNSKILLAEDNAINMIVATKLLEKYGCQITPAVNGLEALQQIKEQDFDLILMDCQMPEMDGYEATAKIRDFQSDNNSKQTPIIAFTANAMKSDQEKCMAAGMDDFISKPVDTARLQQILEKWLTKG